MLLNVQLVLLEGEFDVLGVSIGSKDPVEVTPDPVLLVVEPVVVGSSDCEDVLCHQLAYHAPKHLIPLVTDMMQD